MSDDYLEQHFLVANDNIINVILKWTFLW